MKPLKEGRWTQEEHANFVEGFCLFPYDWK